MQTLNDVIKIRIIGKTLPLPRHGDIILNSMTQTREKWDSLVLSRADFCIVWRCHGIPCFHLFFCLEAKVKKNIWMRTISVMVMIIISKVLFRKLLDFSYVQSSSSTITKHIDNGIWKIFTVVHFTTWINIHANSSEPVLWWTLHQGISLIIVLFFLSQTNLAFKFNLVLIEYFLPQFVYLYLQILCVSWSSSSASTRFYKNQ